MAADDDDLGGLLERGLERRLDHVVALLEPSPVGEVAGLGRQEVCASGVA